MHINKTWIIYGMKIILIFSFFATSVSGLFNYSYEIDARIGEYLEVLGLKDDNVFH